MTGLLGIICMLRFAKIQIEHFSISSLDSIFKFLLNPNEATALSWPFIEPLCRWLKATKIMFLNYNFSNYTTDSFDGGRYKRRGSIC